MSSRIIKFVLYSGKSHLPVYALYYCSLTQHDYIFAACRKGAFLLTKKRRASY
jgi:hypothetical protein